MEKPVEEYHDSITDKTEIDALDKFKTALATITEKKDKAVINPTILLDDDLLILFLRARKCNIKKSVKMILDYLHWRNKVNIEDIYLNYKVPNYYILESHFPHGFHKTDKEGHPVYIQITGFLRPDELFKYVPPEDLLTYSIKIYERAVRELYECCQKERKKYIHGMINIMDFKGVSKSVLNKKLIGYLKNNLKICQDYYPESLEKCFILNAGLIFRALFTTLKVFIDSKSKKKIKVYGAKYLEGLSDTINIEDIPTFFGGKCECPEGCIFSGAGPWKTAPSTEVVPEDALIKRKEITDILINGKLQTNKDDEIKDPKQKLEGVNGEDIK